MIEFGEKISRTSITPINPDRRISPSMLRNIQRDQFWKPFRSSAFNFNSPETVQEATRTQTLARETKKSISNKSLVATQVAIFAALELVSQVFATQPKIPPRLIPTPIATKVAETNIPPKPLIIKFP